jgi:aldehyde:ferredoxin oxidoreductase
MAGYGNILYVDLTQGKVKQRPIDSALRRRYLGGEGINSYLLWEHFQQADPQCEPRDADNVLIAGLGSLGGTPFGAGSKMKWTFKSPVTHMFGDSVSGGHFSSHLRWAGYDHLVITGKAKSPVYLLIQDDKVEIKDAQHLWGLNVLEADDRIRAEVGEEAETALVGRAGEGQVAFSSISVSRHRSAGRAGGGCVMGSKNLKGIAVVGTRGVAIHDPAAFFQSMDRLNDAFADNARTRDGWKMFGTLIITGHYQRTFVNAFRNQQEPRLPDENYQKLSHRWWKANLSKGFLSCSPGCATGCSDWYKLKGNETPYAQQHVGEVGRRPEYLGVASFGITTDVPDMPAVAKLTGLCNDYSMDLVETGAICGLLLELAQRDIITDADTEEWWGQPIPLQWGDYVTIERMIHSLGNSKDPLGVLFKDGLLKGAQLLEERKGAPVLQYANYGKGGAAFTEELRHRPGWMVNMAVGARGADHLKGMLTMDVKSRGEIALKHFGRADVMDEYLNSDQKGAFTVLGETHTAITNSLGICTMLAGSDPVRYPMELFSDAVYNATGLRITTEEMDQAGERIVNLEKAFNSLLGFRREHDSLCYRWQKEGISEGTGKGWKAEDYIDKALDEYYRFHGWDEQTSLPTRQKLVELGLEDVAQVLEKNSALA